MIPYLSERENAVVHIDEICLTLFDAWCGKKSVKPLAYLLHCWPMLDTTPASIRRLGDTLRELRKSHAEELDGNEVRLLCELADGVEEILMCPSMRRRKVTG